MIFRLCVDSCTPIQQGFKWNWTDMYCIGFSPIRCNAPERKSKLHHGKPYREKRLIQLGMDRSLFLFIRLGAPRVQHWVQHSEQKT